MTIIAIVTNPPIVSPRTTTILIVLALKLTAHVQIMIDIGMIKIATSQILIGLEPIPVGSGEVTGPNLREASKVSDPTLNESKVRQTGLLEVILKEPKVTQIGAKVISIGLKEKVTGQKNVIPSEAKVIT